MTKREETIERLTKGISPRDKQKLVDFWSGKGSITAAFWRKYQSQIEEYDRTMKRDSKLEEFLRETRSPYKSRLEISGPGVAANQGEIKSPLEI